MEGITGRGDSLAHAGRQAGRRFSGDAADRRSPAKAPRCHGSSLMAGKRSPALHELGGNGNVGIGTEGNRLKAE